MLLTFAEFEDKNKEDPKFKKILDDACEFPEGQPRILLRLQALQRVDDIVMFHRFVMATHSNNQQVIAPVFAEFNKHYNNAFDSIEGNNEAVITGRLAFRNYDIHKQQQQVACIANESLIINLWATIEQYSTRCLSFLLESGANKKPPHRWDKILSEFNAHQLDLTSLGSYAIIDEMRVLNNKIKHLYKVDDTLAEFDYFKEHLGKELNNVPLRVQDYTIATYHYLCQLVNFIGPSERYTDDEEDECEENSQDN